ncbi:DUF637 domain-containing protein, partial [Verminephrobacter aporrectodeae]|uniref:DUF637 domain-containing protein n=3 Tax=Verminephrobacter aporrectodeae TaxID=1110389 RepID=UPI00224361F5
AAALTAGVLDKLGATSTMTDLSSRTGFSEKLTYNLINATGRALTTTAITGGNLEDALKVALISGLVDTAHGQAASQIKGLEAEYLAHKLAHALAGCVAGAAAGGRCKDGAIGSAIGEVVASMFKPANGMFYTETEKANVLAYSKLVAGAASAYAGGNAQTAITTAEVAVENNSLMSPLAYLLAAATAAAVYTTVVGDGNPMAGLEIIGQGKDPLSEALASVTEKAVTLSMAEFPQETTAMLDFLSGVGETIDAMVTYTDEKTGRVVSTQWNSLSQVTRDRLKGGGEVTTVVLTRGQVRAVKTIITAPKVVNWTTPDITTRGAVNWFTPDKNLRGESFEKHLEKTKFSKKNGYTNLNERQPKHKTFDSYNFTTDHAVSIKTMDTLGLSGSNPMKPWRAAGYLRRYVDEARDYKRVGQPNGIYEKPIKSRSIELAIPVGTPVKVREALDKVVIDALAQGVVVNISVVVK